MTKKLVNADWNEYLFSLSDAEVVHVLYGRLSKSNPELKESDIVRDKYAREYRAIFQRSDGEDVRISIDLTNLKRYFGAFFLGFDDAGIHFYRRMSGYRRPDRKSR